MEETEPEYYKNGCWVMFKTMLPILYKEIINMNISNSIFKYKFNDHLDRLRFDNSRFEAHLIELIVQNLRTYV